MISVNTGLTDGLQQVPNGLIWLIEVFLTVRNSYFVTNLSSIIIIHTKMSVFCEYTEYISYPLRLGVSSKKFSQSGDTAQQQMQGNYPQGFYLFETLPFSQSNAQQKILIFQSKYSFFTQNTQFFEFVIGLIFKIQSQIDSLK